MARLNQVSATLEASHNIFEILVPKSSQDSFQSRSGKHDAAASGQTLEPAKST